MTLVCSESENFSDIISKTHYNKLQLIHLLNRILSPLDSAVVEI